MSRPKFGWLAKKPGLQEPYKVAKPVIAAQSDVADSSTRKVFIAKPQLKHKVSVTCYNCSMKGHYSNECRQPKKDKVFWSNA